MQLRYIDYTDFDHLVNALSQDYKPLYYKIKKIEQTVRLTYGTIKKKTDSNYVMWKSPVSGNVWSIYYIHSFHKNKINVDFYPFTEFSSHRGEKEFLLISKYEKLGVIGSKFTSFNKMNDSEGQNIFRNFLIKHNLFLTIFRGHFTDRFRMRTIYKDYNTFEVIFEFIVNPELFLVSNYQQNQEWMMYLHSHGVAMIKYENNFRVFETFVAEPELKESQTIAIRNYLDSLDDIKYGAVVFLILSSGVWLDIVDKDKLLRFLLRVASTNQVTAKSYIDLNLSILTELWGESFLDLFPFVNKLPA